jgi:hypothetical protein
MCVEVQKDWKVTNIEWTQNKDLLQHQFPETKPLLINAIEPTQDF